MSAMSKLAGLVAGVSTVAVLGVAIAQGQPPNPLVTNHAIGAGQQSSFVTPMGETGVLTQLGEVRTAVIQRQEQVAAAPVAEPAPAAPAPVERVAQAPVEQPQTQSMGAAPAEPMPKQDRN